MSTLQQNGLAIGRRRWLRSAAVASKPRAGTAFFFLCAFFVVYCIRPEDWIPGLKLIPLAKLSAGGALIALLAGAGSLQKKLQGLPREAKFLFAMILLLFLSAFLSPVWKGGAVGHTIDFAKVIVVFVLLFVLVTDIEKLRRIIFVQSASVVVLTAISLIKGHDRPRLEGVIGGIYSNPNDLAFAIVLCIPFCLAFLVTSKNVLWKLLWASGILVMLVALFLTASRAGFIDLIISGTVCLWHFGVRGKRYYLIVITALLGTVLMVSAGKKLVQRFEAISEQGEGDSAHGSYEARKYLMLKAIEGIEHYPILGIGANNFTNYSGIWHEVHMTYLEIAVEGGIPSLILYLLFFGCGFRNLRLLRKRKNLPLEYQVFAGAMHASLIGFVVGALFGPEAYHLFPYFAVAYTSVLLALVNRMDDSAVPEAVTRPVHRRRMRIYGADGKRQPPVTVPR
ncbi:MAG TPA: O-antigen ligase family protein [Candidatus Sulfotelmatobacter sp.]|nr:O-antigen ligase family protein [Candidatus Sulfotelmatobacter sp.]